jgi:YD repeat-containing protein
MTTLATNTYDTGFFTSSRSSPTTMIDSSPPVPVSARGNLWRSVTPAGTSIVNYYSWGSVASATGPDGSSVTLSADAATNYAAPQTIATQSYSTAVAYNSWLGITQTTGANGEQLTMSYDPFTGRPTRAVSPYGASTSYTYNAAGSLPMQQMKAGPDGYTRTTLDGLGRAIRVERGTNASNIQSVTDTVYAPCACSPLGKVQRVSQPYAPGSTPAWTVYSYDGLGRTLSVVQPDGASTTAYAYAGNQTTVTDPAGKWKTFTNDVLNNLATVVEPDPANQPGGTLTTTYSYDWMNHLTGVSMPRSSGTQTRTFVYNGAGLLTSAANPENGTVLYYYNGNNKLQYKHDAKGQETVYSYDGKGRVTTVQRYPQGQGNQEDVCQRVTYTYDTNPVNGSFSQNSYGRLTTAQYGPGVYDGSPVFCSPQTWWAADSYVEMYSYHAAGAVTAKQLQLTRNFSLGYGVWNSGNASLEVDYAYDSAGRVSSTKYPMALPFPEFGQPGGVGLGPIAFTYGSDAMGRPASLTDNSGLTSGQGPGSPPINWVQNVQYDYAGRRTSMQYLDYVDYNGSSAYAQETMSYNANGQLTTTGFGVSGGVQYAYAAAQNNGQITQATDTISGETIGYQYDALKRLVSASSTPNAGSSVAAWTQTYQYDGFGNLTSKALNGAGTSIPVNGATNRLTNSYYDANGNMTTGVGGKFHVRRGQPDHIGGGSIGRDGILRLCGGQ